MMTSTHCGAQNSNETADDKVTVYIAHRQKLNKGSSSTWVNITYSLSVCVRKDILILWSIRFLLNHFEQLCTSIHRTFIPMSNRSIRNLPQQVSSIQFQKYYVAVKRIGKKKVNKRHCLTQVGVWKRSFSHLSFLVQHFFCTKKKIW